MTAQSSTRVGAARPRGRGRSAANLMWRLLVVAGLAVSIWIHWDLAPEFEFTESTLSLADLFRVEAAITLVVAVWVLLRGSLLSFLAAAAVAAGSFVALVGTVYVKVPKIGPLPEIYEPVWYTEKAVCAVALAVTVLAALAGAAAARR